MRGLDLSPLSRRSMLGLGAGAAVLSALPAWAQTAPAAPALDIKAATSEIVYGDPKAKVTVVEYASLACSHCADFEINMLPTFKKEFIDPGEVKLIFRDFPMNAPGLRAHMLMRCAGGAKGLALKTAIMKSQHSWLNQDYLKHLSQIARLSGMSQEQFDACTSDKQLEDFLIKSQYTASQEKQISSTPTFIVNDSYVIMGAKLDELTEAVQKAGAKRKAS